MTHFEPIEGSDAQPLDNVIEVNDVSTFANILTGWHAQKVALLEHMAELPDGTEMTNDDGKTIVIMTGDMLAGFKAGIALALMELGTLPFVSEISAVIPPAADAATQ